MSRENCGYLSGICLHNFHKWGGACKSLIFSELSIIPIRFISSFVVILLAKIQKDFDNVSIFPAFFEKRLKNLEVSEIIPIFAASEHMF